MAFTFDSEIRSRLNMNESTSHDSFPTCERARKSIHEAFPGVDPDFVPDRSLLTDPFACQQYLPAMILVVRRQGEESQAWF